MSHFSRLTENLGRASLPALLAILLLPAPGLGSSSDQASPPPFVRTIGGPGHASMYPSGLDVDSAGTTFVADTGGDRVLAFAPDGRLLWATGSRGPKAPGFFSDPRDVAELDDEVYIADTGYNRVQVLDAATGAPVSVWSRKFGSIMGISAGLDGSGDPIILVSESSTSTVHVYRPSGTLIRSIGLGEGSGNGQLKFARDAATDSAGNIYVADYKNNRVAKFAPNGTWLKNWGSQGTAPGKFRGPYGVDVAEDESVYVGDANNQRIQKFDQQGTYLASWGSEGEGPGLFSMLRRVAVGPGTTPRIYGADLWTYKVERFGQNGSHQLTYGGLPPADGFFNEPYGVFVDQSIFVMDMVNQRVQRFTANGTYELKWGQRGWGEGNPGFNWARDITASEVTDTVWVADTKNDRLIEFARDGSPTGRILGRSGSQVGELNWPFAVAALGEDLIVADTRNHRVERWDPSSGSVVWAASGFNHPKDVAVQGGTVYVADSLNKRVVRLRASDGSLLGTFGGSVLHNVQGVAVEPGGDVWVSDTGWNRLVEFDPSGQYLQALGGLGTAHGKFNQPAHLEITDGPRDYLFVVDWWNDRIEQFDVTE